MKKLGHQKLDTTSAYVNKLSNQERQEHISRLESVFGVIDIIPVHLTSKLTKIANHFIY